MGLANDDVYRLSGQVCELGRRRRGWEDPERGGAHCQHFLVQRHAPPGDTSKAASVVNEGWKSSGLAKVNVSGDKASFPTLGLRQGRGAWQRS